MVVCPILVITALISCQKNDDVARDIAAKLMSTLIMESETPDLFQNLDNQLRGFIDDGKIKETQNTANSPTEEELTVADENANKGPELARALEVKADLNRQLEEYDEAISHYEEALSLLGTDSEDAESLGRICASLAVIHDIQGNTMGAKSHYERAIACFERLTPPALLDVADLSNNLAFIYEAEDNFDKAETLLLKALKITHETLGEKHEQTAALYNNVGSLYFKAEYDEQARKMHMMALDGRLEIFGDHHLETAQSHGNLALVFVKSNDLDAAKRHFDRALDAYEGNLAKGRDDYEIVAANYRDVLASIGDDKAVAALEERTKAKLS